MKKFLQLIKKELMLSLALIAAIISLFITPVSSKLIKEIDWHTLGMLFMMLCVLEGFKQENIFRPLIRLAGGLKKMRHLTLFLVFGVFFTSMFVTNDVSLIIFVPLTILLFRGGGKEKFILPVITFENIAAIRGSLLMPFGSPQNLFFYGRFGKNAAEFILMMAPLCIMSAVLLIVFILILYRKNPGEEIVFDLNKAGEEWKPERKSIRISYIILFIMIITLIVTRTSLWPFAILVVIAVIFVMDRALFKKVDYILLLTFLCFFVFSSQIAANEGISEVLKKAVTGHEYFLTIGVSQFISNVPASIVLFPFSENYKALIYGADTAGLVSLIGSLASVINYRIYVREYPGRGGKFIKVFTLISWAFFAIVVIPGFLLSR